MDKLLKSLAEAVRLGSAFAWPALVGFYIVRIVEAVIIPITFVGLGIVITRCVRYGINPGESDEKRYSK